MRKILTGLLLLLFLCGCAEKTGTDGREQETFANPSASGQQVTAPREAPEAEGESKPAASASIPAAEAIATTNDFAAVTDDTVYFSPMSFFSSQLIYYDKASGFSGPLCGKAECDHTGPDCNAYVGKLCSGLSVAGDRLYWLGGDGYTIPFAFRSCRLDGTDQRILANVDTDVRISLNRQRSFFDGDVMYYYGYAEEMRDGQPVLVLRVYVYDGTDSAGNLMLEEELPGFDGNVLLALREDRIHAMFHSAAGTPGEAEQHLRLYAWDRREREPSLVYEGEVPFMPWGFAPTEDGYLISETADFSHVGVYHLNPQTGELTLWRRFDTEEGYIDEVSFTGEYLIGDGTDDERATFVWVMDYAGNTLVRRSVKLDFMVPGTIYGRTYYACDGEAVYYNIMDTEEPGAWADYLVRIPLDGSDPEIVWSGTE